MSRWLSFLSSGFGPEGNNGCSFYFKHMNILKLVNISKRLYMDTYKEHTLLDGWSQYATLVSMVIHSRGKELYLCSDSSFLTVSIFHCHEQHANNLSNSNSQQLVNKETYCMIRTHLQFHELSHKCEIPAEVNMSRRLEFEFSLPLFLTCVHNTTERQLKPFWPF